MPINYASQYIVINEPELLFSATEKEYCHKSPIVGLSCWGPYDSSISGLITPNNPIRLAIISVHKKVFRLLEYLNSLNNTIRLSEANDYLVEYEGFYNIYKTKLFIPTYENNLIQLISQEEIEQCKNTEDKEIRFIELIKKYIRNLLPFRDKFDVIIFHVTDEMSVFERVNINGYIFDLRDHIKAFCAPNNLKIQFIREKSIPSNENLSNVDYVRKAWWLSLAIYCKAGGIPYKLKETIPRTAYVGLSYAISATSRKNKIVLGVSQIFDETGEGIRFRLLPVKKPLWDRADVYKKNPFMSKEDARQLFITIRQDYQAINGEPPKRVVVHKTTPFRAQEIAGICEALTGIDEIELLTIQSNVLHRLIRGADDQKDATGKPIKGVAKFPVKRGTILPLDTDTFLFFTQGDVEGINLIDGRYHYYQEGRNIPRPILVQRYLGTAPVETVAEDILKLTKMNWNNLQLYNRLPVTIIFAHRIAQIVKQVENYSNIPFDFRYYI